MSKKEDAYEVFEGLDVGKQIAVKSDEVAIVRAYLNRYRTETGRVLKSRYDRDSKDLIIWRVL